MTTLTAKQFEVLASVSGGAVIKFNTATVKSLVKRGLARWEKSGQVATAHYSRDTFHLTLTDAGRALVLPPKKRWATTTATSKARWVARKALLKK